jgi:hypothetical protein
VHYAREVLGLYLERPSKPFGRARESQMRFRYGGLQHQAKTDKRWLLPKGSGWTITDATAINDEGQIAGWGINALGFRRAYLLSPVLLPFSGLYASADQVDIRKPAFAASGRFTLGANSNGIYPVTETVVLELGGYHISIAPSSFVERYLLSRHNRQCRHRSSNLAHCAKEFFIHHRRRRCNGSAIRFLIVVGFDNRR